MIDGIRNAVAGFFSKAADIPIDEFFDKGKSPPPTAINKMADELQQAETVSFVQNRFKEVQDKKKMLELQVLLNTAFLDGNQHVDINGSTLTIEEATQKYDYEVREVYNEIAPIYDTRLAKLGRVKPALRTRPATNETNDINTAKTCTAIVRGTYADLGMSELIDEANAWSELAGTVFYKQVWKKDGGKLVGYGEDGSPVHEGKPDTVIASFFEIFPASLFIEDVQKQRFIIHAKAAHVDEIEEMYGKKVTGREVNVYSLTSTEIGIGGLGYSSQQPRMRSIKEKNHEIILEYWEKPNLKYPKGRLIVVAGRTLLYYAEELPYMVGDDNVPALPFVKQIAIKAPGRFFGRSVVERLIPVQRKYNNIHNRIDEYLNRMTIGILEVEEGSIENMDDIEEYGFEPGMVIYKKKGFESPHFLEYNNLPAQFQTEIDWCIQEFIRISGVSELSRDSSIPTGTGSGIALNILKEQDDTRMSLPADYIRKAVMNTGAMWLRLFKQFSTGPRILRFVGEDNMVQVLDWEASDITSDDVEVENENELTRTPAQREQMIKDFMEAGLFNDPATGQLDTRMRQKILDMFSLGTFDDAFDLTDLQMKQAQRENMFLEKGSIPKVGPFDDHSLHIPEHIKYHLSMDYQKLLETNPELAQQLDIHIMDHQQKQFAQQQQQMGASAGQAQQAGTPTEAPQQQAI